MINPNDLMFIAKVLEWKNEKPEQRTVEIKFRHYASGVGATLFSKDVEKCFFAESIEKWEYSLEDCIEKMNKLESEFECRKEKSEEQKLAISCDAEQSGITVGTNA